MGANGDFVGRVAIVTGAAGGMGRATALLLAAGGADVVCVDLDQGKVDAVADACMTEGQGTQAVGMAVNQRSSHEVDAMVKATAERFGRIDVLANVAGVWPFALVKDCTDEAWQTAIEVNLTGAFYCCRAAVPFMLDAGRGSIVNVASGAAVRPVVGLGGYAASKGGIVAFSRVLAQEVAPGVRVNVVAPGPTGTGMSNTPGSAISDLERAVVATTTDDIPLGRMGRYDELAEAISWLCSDRASFVTGATLHVNGGRYMP